MSNLPWTLIDYRVVMCYVSRRSPLTIKELNFGQPSTKGFMSTPNKILLFTIIVFFSIIVVLARRMQKRVIVAGPSVSIAFYTNNIFPIIQQIKGEQFGIKKLNLRHRQLADSIFRRYGKSYNVEIAVNYGESETNAGSTLAICYLETNGSPVVRLYVPTAIWIFASLSQSGDTNWQTQFAYAIVIGYYHAMDHLSEGLFNTNMAVEATVEQKMAYETGASALTCEKTIRPIIEFPGTTLSKNDRDLYEAWVRCGKDEKSQLWRETVRKRWGL